MGTYDNKYLLLGSIKQVFIMHIYSIKKTAMKKILQIFTSFSFLFIYAASFAQTAKPFAIADFKTAAWEVNNNGSVYAFTVSNPKGSVATDFEFDWAMTSGDDMNGHIKITKEAMKAAIVQNNYFGPRLKNATLTDKTTVWVSQDVFTQLKKTGTAKMDVGNGGEIFTVVANDDNEDKAAFNDNVMVKGNEKTLVTMHIKNQDGSRQLWILSNPQNPVIVKMDLGWTIVLKSVN